MYSLEFIKSRHSVRRYLDKAIPKEFVDILQEEIRQCNLEGNINLQLVLNDDNAFSGIRANYGSIKGVKNYIVLVGKRCKDLDEKLGYYGERIVLKAHELGLNTCWIGLSMLYKKTKGAYEVNKGETKRLIIAIGYGENQGHPRSSKIFDDVTNIAVKEIPDWFKNGVEYSLFAPTATNQQKFVFELCKDGVRLKDGVGFYSKVDKGIVKYHFELGAGTENFNWIK